MNPSWHDVVLIAGAVITLLLGVIIAMIGAYTKGLASRVDSLEKRHTNLNNLVLSQYHNKDDIRELLGDIKGKIDALHNRFDLILLQHKDS